MRNRSTGPLTPAALLLIVAVTQAPAQPVRRDGVVSNPPSYVRMVFFAPADVATPNGLRERMTQIADTTDAFFFKWMNRWGYPPAAKTLFRRESDGLVEVLTVRGDLPVASGKYGQP